MARRSPETEWAVQAQALRNPAQIISHWADAAAVSPEALHADLRGPFWDLLEELHIHLLVSREYENFVVCLSPDRRQTYLPLPHPSGIAVRPGGSVHIASTRNPNEVFELKAANGSLERGDSKPAKAGNPLLPTRSAFYPGSLYMHDLAWIGDRLYAASPGHNAIVRLEEGGFGRDWWPTGIDSDAGPRFDRNYLQLNSIAAGPTLDTSFFTASAACISARRPGHRNFPVDRRGVLFSGSTRSPVAGGLTRPHSARMHAGNVFVDNSGYGELSVLQGDRFETVAKLPGWTRGLALTPEVAFVGVSRILPRFTQYAPGVSSARARCGVYAVEISSGKVVASLKWRAGSQIFAIEPLPLGVTTGLPFTAQRRTSKEALRSLFYAFDMQRQVLS